MSPVLRTEGDSGGGRHPRRGRLRFWVLSLALLVVSGTAISDPGDVVYYLTLHGSTPSGGVDRDPAYDVGACRQCHESRSIPGSAFTFGLFTDPDNGLCFDCHGTNGVYDFFQGDLAYLSSEHWLSGGLLWPGPDPVARMLGEEGYCLNCHTPHGRSDGTGLIPELGIAREEALCLSCHNAAGPAGTDIETEVMAADAHPVLALTDVHTVAELLGAAAFGAGNRHAECVDCHNPHVAEAGDPNKGVTRIGVVNGGALTVPTYVPRAADDATAPVEYEICFKCHSSWTTLPAGARDLAYELNVNNASFHPIEGPGTNTTGAMNGSLIGGTGTPSLTTASVITCSDCHGMDTLPTTFTTVASYIGAIATGPHGSAAGSAIYSAAILRANYRVTLKSRTASWNAGEFELCGVCHDLSDIRNDNSTNFDEHGKHVSGIDDKGAFDGDINTPGSGRGNAICKECHYSIHGVAGAFHPSNAGNPRLVSFAPNVEGENGTGEPFFTPGECRLLCHGKDHDPKTY